MLLGHAVRLYVLAKPPQVAHPDGDTARDVATVTVTAATRPDMFTSVHRRLRTLALNSPTRGSEGVWCSWR